jgi:hypothetical protein
VEHGALVSQGCSELAIRDVGKDANFLWIDCGSVHSLTERFEVTMVRGFVIDTKTPFLAGILDDLSDGVSAKMIRHPQLGRSVDVEFGESRIWVAASFADLLSSAGPRSYSQHG